MNQSLIGSRYELYVARKGAAETRAARDYFALHPVTEPGAAASIRANDRFAAYPPTQRIDRLAGNLFERSSSAVRF
jgi:hypothetical protein